MASDLHERICDVVARIPEGRVATYGQIARIAGVGGHARLVGYALHAARRPLPWHRVINARGEVSRRRGAGDEEAAQYRLLVSEGISFDHRGRVPLERFRWGEEQEWGRHLDDDGTRG